MYYSILFEDSPLQTVDRGPGEWRLRGKDQQLIITHGVVMLLSVKQVGAHVFIDNTTMPSPGEEVTAPPWK